MKYYNTDFGSGICIREHHAENINDAVRPPGYVIEIHFYQKQDAVKCAVEFIREQVKRAKEENDSAALEKTIGLLGGTHA